jgi:hypothetical protein
LEVARAVLLNEKPILVVCDDPLTANELATRITRAQGDIAYASNKPQVLQLLKQFQFAAAVTAHQVDADGIAEALKTSGVPLCLIENSAPTAVAAPAGDVVVVADLDLVVPALRALIVQRTKGNAPSA